MRCTIVRIHRWFLFVDGPLNGFYRDIRDKSMQLLYLFVNIDRSIDRHFRFRLSSSFTISLDRHSNRLVNCRYHIDSWPVSTCCCSAQRQKIVNLYGQDRHFSSHSWWFTGTEVSDRLRSLTSSGAGWYCTQSNMMGFSQSVILWSVNSNGLLADHRKVEYGSALFH